MEPARYSISQEDHIAFVLLHFRRNIPGFLIAGSLAVCILCAGAFVYDDGNAALAVAIGGVLGMGGMFAIIRYFSVPRHAKRAWQEFALIKEQMELRVSEGGFELDQPSAHVKSSWCDMVAWNEDERVFAIYVTQQQAYILPKGQIEASLIDYARTQLIESGLQAKGKKRK